MHPSAVLKGAELRSVGEQLSAATATAASLGVSDVPAVRVGERVFHGERSLEQAKQAAMHARARIAAAEQSPGTSDAAHVAARITADAETRRTP